VITLETLDISELNNKQIVLYSINFEQTFINSTFILGLVRKRYKTGKFLLHEILLFRTLLGLKFSKNRFLFS